jgi:hypothetical protein
MREAHQSSRGPLLPGAAGLAAAGVVGVAVPAAGGTASGGGRTPPHRQARKRGIAYGTSAATWRLADEEYARLVAREAARTCDPSRPITPSAAASGMPPGGAGCGRSATSR